MANIARSGGVMGNIARSGAVMGNIARSGGVMANIARSGGVMEGCKYWRVEVLAGWKSCVVRNTV